MKVGLVLMSAASSSLPLCAGAGVSSGVFADCGRLSTTLGRPVLLCVFCDFWELAIMFLRWRIIGPVGLRTTFFLGLGGWCAPASASGAVVVAGARFR